MHTQRLKTGVYEAAIAFIALGMTFGLLLKSAF